MALLEHELVFGLSVYYVVNHVLSLCGMNLSEKGWFKQSVFVHNIALSVFSAYIFVNGFKVMSGMTWMDIYGETSNVLIQDEEFSRLVYYFYWSKYYEFVDTWINLLKRRDPGFLQVYHHTGAVIVMGMGAHYKAQSIWIFMMWNSFVHTIMYLYYALATLKVKINGKYMLTGLQIGQLVTGLVGAWYYVLFTKMENIHLWGCIMNLVYVKGLIFLFSDFYSKTYRKKIE